MYVTSNSIAVVKNSIAAFSSWDKSELLTPQGQAIKGDINRSALN